MGFFKNLTKGISKVVKGVSLKNVVKVATGRGSEVGAELINRGKNAIGIAIAGTNGGKSAPTAAEKVLINAFQGASTQIKNNITDSAAIKLSNGSQTSNAILDGIQSLGGDSLMKAYWTKYKLWIIGGAIAIIAGVTWLVRRGGNGKRKPNRSTSSYRRY